MRMLVPRLSTPPVKMKLRTTMLLRNSPPGARAIKTRFVTAPARARSRNLRAAVAIGLAGEAATRLNGARQLLPQPTTCNRHSAHHCRLQPLSHGRRQLHPPPHGLGPRGHKAHKSQTKDHEEGTPQGRREAPRRQSETAAQDQAGRRGREARAAAATGGRAAATSSAARTTPNDVRHAPRERAGRPSTIDRR